MEIKTEKQIEDYRPFLDWVEANDDLTVAEINFIKGFIQFNHKDVTGIWGYLLEFFDSVEIDISVFPKHDWTDQKIECFMFIIKGYKYSDQFKTRQEAQQEAVEKALELINSKKIIA